MTFDKAIELIREEREYQKKNEYTLGEECALLHELLQRATCAYYDTYGSGENVHALNFIRKIAGNCVRIIEHNDDTPSRYNYEETYLAYRGNINKT